MVSDARQGDDGVYLILLGALHITSTKRHTRMASDTRQSDDDVYLILLGALPM